MKWIDDRRFPNWRDVKVTTVDIRLRQGVILQNGAQVDSTLASDSASVLSFKLLGDFLNKIGTKRAVFLLIDHIIICLVLN